MLENAVAEVFAGCVDPVREFVARRRAADGLAWLRKACERRGELLLRRSACDRFAGPGQRCQTGGEVHARAIDVDAIAPRHGGVDAGAKMEMLVLGQARVLHAECAVHGGGGMDGFGHGLETSQQSVAKAFDKGTVMSGQYLSGDGADEVRPSAHAAGFVFANEPHQFTRSTSRTTVSCRTSAASALRALDKAVRAVCLSSLSAASSLMRYPDRDFVILEGMELDAIARPGRPPCAGCW